MSSFRPNRPRVIRRWAFRASLACGLTNLLLGVAGIAYCATAFGFDLREMGVLLWAGILALFGGVGVLPGILFCALAVPLRRGGRLGSFALLPVGGLHACVVAWLLAHSVSLLQSSLRYNPGSTRLRATQC
jgi:hypothetical protein